MSEPINQTDLLHPQPIGPLLASDAGVQKLLQQVIAAVDSSTAGAASCPDGQRRVLLDAALGDVRYILIRLPIPNGSSDRLNGSCLSPREREVARMVAKGLTNKSIARVLDISLWTVSTHLRRIFAKLGVATRAAMVARVLEEDSPLNGYVEPYEGVVLHVNDAIC